MKFFKFNNLKIASKLILGFIIVALIAGVVGIVGLININGVVKADKLLYEENTLGLQYGSNAAIYFQKIGYYTLKMLVDTDPTARADSIKNVNDSITKVESLLELYKGRIKSKDDEEQYKNLFSVWTLYKETVNKSIRFAEYDNAGYAKENLFGAATGASDVLQQQFDKTFEYNSNTAKIRSDENNKLADKATIIMIIIIIIGILLSILLGMLISRIISKPIEKMVTAADRLALGDVSINVDSNSKDEIGSLMRSFGSMIENIRGQALAAERMADGDLTIDVDIKSEEDLLGRKLKEMLEKNKDVLTLIRTAAEQVASGSSQVSNSSAALSQGATEQASSIEELTASLEEIASQTKLNAQNANQASEIAELAKHSVEQGKAQMSEMLNAMEDINTSSSNISKIIKVIDDIAFQTNMLALNAAVEAARVGQHGRGFAVVAEEVRNLAARSANAAKETTSMIESSMKKITDGAKIANNTADALNSIATGTSKLVNLVNDIAVSSNEQASGIAQINQGILQVSKVVQTNSATSEETASASEQLSSQAQLLKESVSKFVLEKSDIELNTSEESDNEEAEDMQESVLGKIKLFSDTKEKAQAEAASSKAKIALSDKEFGKY